MTPATRAWLAFPAIGAGIIHLALALTTPLPFAVVLARYLRRADASAPSRGVAGVVAALLLATVVTGASIAVAPHQVDLPTTPPSHGH